MWVDGSHLGEILEDVFFWKHDIPDIPDVYKYPPDLCIRGDPMDLQVSAHRTSLEELHLTQLLCERWSMLCFCMGHNETPLCESCFTFTSGDHYTCGFQGRRKKLNKDGFRYLIYTIYDGSPTVIICFNRPRCISVDLLSAWWSKASVIKKIYVRSSFLKRSKAWTIVEDALYTLSCHMYNRFIYVLIFSLITFQWSMINFSSKYKHTQINVE